MSVLPQKGGGRLNDSTEHLRIVFFFLVGGGRPGGVLPPPPPPPQILNLDTTLIIYMYRLPLEVGPYHPECMYRPDVRDGVASLVGGAVDRVLGVWCLLLIRKRCVGLQSMAGRGVNEWPCIYSLWYPYPIMDITIRIQ